MNRFGSRRGSALLIVLGMMSFIIVSAVAFSAYMRFARLPSSYLRRTSSSRLLVKAALAEAIDAVDAAIGNNPYPGVGGQTSRGSGFNRNIWTERVFTGTNSLIGADTTVSTLTMEALAYIPPPFINEVRYYSRRTPTAKWQTLNYDAGRYAYCAVDVSDCFDVNRLIACSARSSADDGRITLAHCFENPSHSDYTVDPEDWDDFMDDFDASKGSKIPLVSVADMNLAIADKKPGGIDDLSPFCKYLRQSGNAKFVTDNTDGNKVVELQRNLAFVTDSYFAPTNRAADAIDLSRERDQPFYGLKAGKFTSESETKNDDTLDQVMQNNNRFTKKYANNIMPPEMIQLYDYLDRDSVPLSLALPTVERTPMVTGVALDGEMSLTVALREKQFESGGNAGQAKETYRVRIGDLKLVGNLRAVAGFVYPFKYDHGAKKTFKAQVAATVTLVPEGSEKTLRRINAKTPAVMTTSDWSASQKTPSSAKYGNEDTPVVVTMQSKPVTLSPNAKILTEEEAVLDDQQFDLGALNVEMTGKFPDLPMLANVNVDDAFKKGTFREVQKIIRDSDGTEKVADTSFDSSLKPSNAELSTVQEMGQNKRYVPVVQLYVRVLDSNNNVVDLVPAYFGDDTTESKMLPKLVSCSRERPVLRFYQEAAAAGADAAIKNDKTMLEYGTKKVVLYPYAYMANDPRFNFAPENLIALDKSKMDGTFKVKWLKEQNSAQRDGDIFMMTSDAGYLQSAYELTALLDICGLDGSADMSVLNSASYNGTIRTDINGLPSAEAMWRTYSQFPTPDESGYCISRHFDITNGDRGFRVNPFTRDENIMMAALANTPIDWWAASTNTLKDAGKKSFAGGLVRGRNTVDLDEGAKYTFSEFPDAQVKFRHGTRRNSEGTLLQVAQQLVSQFGSAGNNWQSKFDAEGNWNSETGVMGVDLGVDLHSVDKKFLHGFWRECFANRQHLFLIFVRAEPMMMGGGGLGQTPPQLGARAVALVWRDPKETREDVNGGPRPHRTRVLFYRQLD